ncbi:stage II sporulation protein GA (sporulation sigma-E factor processing peptidase) [Evansella caseinilytica]|uniref:Sporulation sigma-E factor-processing peptidase n=1 Tax=Evansella caseinilytica TaxID=1503961 RepID=A0A1H3MG74_9BACI|nr:sigma-E processing peptidase SpoIIGA [Evansella caseinilytica]SDY75700.1 stage II sporulation protein GA (sporulation sigma-E factor processing peptidase) [Evansella caseinilytica]
MVIYLDIVWLLNFFIDLLLLSLTAIVLKRSPGKLRLFAGGFVASLYVFFLFTPFEAVAMHPGIKGLYSVVIILVSFGFYRFRLFIQAWFTFFFVNFAVGGGLLGLHYFLKTDSSFIKGTFATQTSGFGSPVSWLFVIAGLPLVYWYSRKQLEDIETEKIRYDQIYPVIVQIAGTEIQLKGFVDSGNRLEDPLTRRPVMIIDMTVVGNQFPNSIVQMTKKSAIFEEDFPEKFAGRMTIVPFRTVGNHQRFLWAVKPDEVIVDDNGQPYRCRRVLVGLSHTPLSDCQDYDCLLHPSMMQKKKQTS